MTALSQFSRDIETQLEGPSNSTVNQFMRNEALRQIPASKLGEKVYNLYVLLQDCNNAGGPDIIRLPPVRIGAYTDTELHGAIGSRLAKFRAAVKILAKKAVEIAALDSDGLEYGHQVSLFWGDLGKLNEFIGASPSISELVAELRTVRFQFFRKDTPPAIVKALSSVLQFIADTDQIDAELVDRIVDVLEDAGTDPMILDALRDRHA